ncbi:uncharacterized protein LOC116197578 [Punica granatum]|uniref:Uncharacterized protein LOC116197578 n=1 Tax=Punica granatum TaxID=22663 RepID=A0A218WBY6_PUNGR|nr:uncharacterized protein LOC116197578 [Punica granatum]OWM70053.1 hypothetical protein CDL15_Pgr025902 [Punica granatum]
MEQGDQSHNQTNTHLTDGSNAIPAEGVGRLPSRRRRNGRPERDSRKKSTFETHDHNSVGYEWLHPGWVAEVHETKLGRVYKRYFDERGRPYNTKKEVLRHYAEWERLCDGDFRDEE